MAVVALAAAFLLASAATGAASAEAARKPHHGKLYDFTYDLLTAAGNVKTFDGSAWWGSMAGKKLNAPMIGMAVAPGGFGYWLAGSDGGVFTFGTAKFYGSLGATKLPPSHAVVAIAASPGGLGYWLVDKSGVVTPFGDASHLGSLPASDVSTPIVAAAFTPDGKGAWLTNAAGDVYTLGTAPSYGSEAGEELPDPITAMVATPDGKGYWLAASNGDVYSFGDAVKAKPPPARMLGSIVSIVPARDELGFWATTDEGWVLPGGDALSRGGINGYVDGSPVVAIAAVPRWDGKLPGPPTPYPSGSIGYDVSWPQCAASSSSNTGPMPGPPSYPSGTSRYTIAVVGVDGWAVDADNSCLAAEVGWAKRAEYPGGKPKGSPSYELYLFINSPASTSTIDQSGPAGTCSSLSGPRWAACLAYNYGYNAAKIAVSYANSNGAKAGIWWLDVENDVCAPGIYNDVADGEYWSCHPALNARTIQGTIDALRAEGITPGIYSTAVQYQGISDDYVPRGAQIPIWIAGAYWTSPPYPASYHYLAPSANEPYCAATDNPYAFAGGKVVMLQETPGPNNYPYDPDYAC